MQLEIVLKEVNSLRMLKQFVEFQYTLYKNNAYWVPPVWGDEIKSLRAKTNPAFEFCEAKYWLAYQGDKIVGRIAGIINHKYNERWGAKAARFGWIDFIDDENVVRELFAVVEQWAKEKGMKFMHGPLGFTDLDGEGTLVEGFNELGTLGAIYNYSYYPARIEAAGYKKDADWLEFQITIKDKVHEQIVRIADIVLKRYNLTVLQKTTAKEILPYAKDLFYVLNDAYKDLYGFVELSEKQIEMYIKQYFSFILPEYVPIVLDNNNRVVAFSIAMPSLSLAMQKCKGKLFPTGFIHILRAIKKHKYADAYLTGVRSDYRNKGVNAIILKELTSGLIKNKVPLVESNRELELNDKVQAQWRYYDHRQHKRRRCYKKDI